MIKSYYVLCTWFIAKIWLNLPTNVMTTFVLYLLPKSVFSFRHIFCTVTKKKHQNLV
jgi:hypothetical protein